MQKGTLMSGVFGSLASILGRVASAKPIAPMVEYNDDGQIIIHLNQLIPVGKDSFNFSYPILLGLINSCFHNGHWKVTPAQFMNIREDMQERLPGLMCDIGGLFAHEVDIILGFQLSPAAYRLDHRIKGSTGLMKHTETFTFENLDHILPSRKEKESMNTNTQAPRTHVIHINRFLGSSPEQRQSILQNYLLNETQDFFVDQLDALQACHAIAPSLELLFSLALNHYVEVTVWSRCEPGHPGWEFKCIKREAALGDHDGDRPLGGAYGGHFGGFMGAQYQPNMGMFNGPYGGIDNNMLCELLNLYSLTQIQPLPYQARGRHFPAGLELLDLVKERLGHISFGMQQTMPPNMFNMSMPNTGARPNGPGYASANFMDQRMPFDGRYGHARGTYVEGGAERFTRFIPGNKISTHASFDTTPPEMLDGDILLGAVIDNAASRLIFVAGNRELNAYVVYQGTRMGNLIDRCVYPTGVELADHPFLLSLLELPTTPYQTFTFSVADKMEDTLYSIKGQIQGLMMQRHQHEQIPAEVFAVLAAKPISSSEHVKLNFTLGHPAFFPEGLQVALPDENSRLPSTCGPLAWIIHTDLAEGGHLIPDRFWVLDSTIVPPRNW